MRRLILTRHAKSDWSGPATRDHDRPLNPRGRDAATRLGGWLAGKGHIPDQVLCSTAERTRETWARIAPALPGEIAIDYLPELYHAAPMDMMAALQGATGQTVLILGHNPGIGAFAHAMPREMPAHVKFTKYPTAATLILDFAIEDWREVQPGTGEVVDFVIPRELD